ncbi:hypothetical protein ACQ4PT_049784 [Festuca glaucescens]
MEATAGARQNVELVETRMRCGNKSQVFVGVEGRYDETIEGCDAVVLPVLGNANGEANPRDYERLIRAGFVLAWQNPPPLARKFTNPNHAFLRASRSLERDKQATYASGQGDDHGLVGLHVNGEQRLESCSSSSKRCGNLTVSDPFWVVDSETGTPCGAPSFEVFCDKNIPSLLSNGQFGLTILNITYEPRSLHAIDRDKLRLMQASNICGMLPSWNTSVRPNPPFRISSANLELIMYNCTGKAAAVARQNEAVEETRLRCRNENEVFVRAGWLYDETRDNATGYAVDGCNAIVVPVLSSSGDANTSSYKQLINDGFLLTWDDPSQGPPPVPVADLESR